MMLLKNTVKILLIIIITPVLGWAENSNLPNEKTDKGVDFEQILKNYDVKKQKELDAVTQALTAKLNPTVESWINLAKNDKENNLGSRVQQRWEKLASIYHIPPGYYEYSLRGYKYAIVKNDLSKTDSLTSPYKAAVIIKEELYVEKSHSPNISNTDLYFFTVTTNYNLSYEYINDKFVLANTESKIVNIINNAPEEIKKYGKLI